MSSSSVYCRANLQLEKDLSGYLPMIDLQELQESASVKNYKTNASTNH